jgi:D-alanyl-lipoteichoic acid acyltransferase DltB (MBOAT superfamily)
MFFNSIDFALFLPIVFGLYWFVFHKNLKAQNGLVVVASYFFYGWWDWRFLGLIFLSTLVDYWVGRGLATEKQKSKRQLLLWVSITVNLGLLGFFKYYDFFLDNFVSAFSLFGMEIQGSSLNLILPVGISFYTFQTLSYTIDVYKKKLEPTQDFVAFTAFVSFFPQLVAGPIERATHLLPQFYSRRNFQYTGAASGMRQILWGLFKKVVIADNCAHFVDEIFANAGAYSGSTLVLGAVLFAFQIYGDFSGYSDIAIGTARLFGFKLMRNFAFPYFSRDMAEFWRRWHISLSTWFRDYVYIPLGGSKHHRIRNVFIIFLVSGFWHGANWTFIVWGALHALFFLPLILTQNNRNHLNVAAPQQIWPGFKTVLQILLTFSLSTFAWIFFRADSLESALHFIGGIMSTSLFNTPEILPLPLFVLIGLFIAVEWLNREKEFDPIKTPRWIRWGTYLVISYGVAAFFGKGTTFIYFQF